MISYKIIWFFKKYHYYRCVYKPITQMNNIWKLLQSKKTVFTYQNLQSILWIQNRDTLKSFLERQIKAWILIRPYKWIYALQDFDIFEFATKIKTQSYISFETVLKKEWIIFQDYWKTIFLASDNSIEKKAFWYTFKCLKVKDNILYNPIWLINKWWYFIATKERAICDRLYLSQNYYFDNLEWINKEKLLEISQIYSQRVFLHVKQLIENA